MFRMIFAYIHPIIGMDDLIKREQRLENLKKCQIVRFTGFQRLFAFRIVV